MYSLNLLPPKVQQETAQNDTLSYWIRSVIILLVSSVIGSGILGAAWFTLDRHAQSLQGQLRTAQTDQRKNSATDITTTTNQLNATMKLLSSSLGAANNWSANELAVLQLLPKGAKVSEFTLESTGQFHLTGVADTRQTFITLDTAIKNASTLTAVTTTLTASRRTDVPFNYTGSLATAKK